MRSKQNKKQYLTGKLEQLMDNDKRYLASDVNRDTIATALGTNRTYLCTYIRDTYRQTFPEYINELRLKTALDLFNSGTYDIQEVAEIVGYTCYSSFYRAFMKKYGVRPTDYLNIKKSEDQ